MTVTDIAYTLLPLAGTAALAGAVFALTKLGSYLDTKASGNKVLAALAVVDHAALAVVSNFQAVAVPSLKAAQANGKLTDADVTKLRAEALASLKSVMGSEGLSDLAKLLGVAVPALDPLLQGLIENKVSLVNSPK
jgi:hypothetical protein